MKEARTYCILLAVSVALLALAFGPQTPVRGSPAGSGLTQEGPAGSTQMAQANTHLIPAVVYMTDNGHIHELARKAGSWQDRDLTEASQSPSDKLYPKTVAFQRSDGVPMILYRGADLQHIYALYMELAVQDGQVQEVWHWADLNDITGAPDAISGPYGYVRSDGISTVVYTGVDSHIHDLRLEGSWIWSDLTAISGAPDAKTWRCPTAYVRGDGINAVVFVDDAKSHIYELRLEGTWHWADLTDLSGAPVSFSDLSAYVRSDGISAIVFMGDDFDLHELRLDESWKWTNLTTASGSPWGQVALEPFGYVRSDGVSAVVYAEGMAFGFPLIAELTLDNGWHYNELTSIPDAVLGDAPIGYVRADGVSAVVYQGKGGSIQEFYLTGTWHRANLTELAKAPKTYGWPWPYNRIAAISRIYLPYVRR